MFRFIKLLCIPLVSSFTILNTVNPVFPKIIEPCPRISRRLLKTSKEVSSHFTDSGYPVIIDSTNSSGRICNQPQKEYGYTIPYENYTSIFISNRILSYPNSLYNVVLHEILHSCGLHHSNKKGMMNYAVSENIFRMIKEDSTKLWLSFDDLSGLYYLKNSIKNISYNSIL